MLRADTATTGNQSAGDQTNRQQETNATFEHNSFIFNLSAVVFNENSN